MANVMNEVFYNGVSSVDAANFCTATVNKAYKDVLHRDSFWDEVRKPMSDAEIENYFSTAVLDTDITKTAPKGNAVIGAAMLTGMVGGIIGVTAALASIPAVAAAASIAVVAGSFATLFCLVTD